MAKQIRVPSLQHLARTWYDDPTRICKEYVKLAENTPRFNYNPLFGAVQDHLLFGQPYDQIKKGMELGVKRDEIRANFLEVLPLIRDHFEGIRPDYIQPVSTRYYPVGRGLMVPFIPPIYYAVDGKTYFPWFSFWRRNPLANERLSLFATLVKEILADDPDLDDAKFEILDFSVPKGAEKRELIVYDAASIAVIPDHEKVEMLSVFAEGFFLAQTELEGKPAEDKRDDDRPSDSDQDDLFD